MRPESRPKTCWFSCSGSVPTARVRLPKPSRFALGDYARVFPAEVLMEAQGERHPTELAQFMGVRFALTSEPASSATWNDSRIKSLTGDATISARFMRGDFFEFQAHPQDDGRR